MVPQMSSGHSQTLVFSKTPAAYKKRIDRFHFNMLLVVK